MESTVNPLVNSLHGPLAQPSTASSQLAHSSYHAPSFSHSDALDTTFPGHSVIITRIKQLTAVELDAIAELYLDKRAYQPLSVFATEDFHQSLHRRDDRTLAAILLVTIRHAQSIGSFSHGADAKALREVAVSSIMEDTFRGVVQLSTLQTLCLILLHDIEDGGNDKVISLLCLATMLTCQEMGRLGPPRRPEAVDEETRCCYWSIALLQRLLGFASPVGFTIDPKMLPYPKSCSRPPLSTIRPAFRHAHEHSKGDSGIMIFIFEMSAEWTNALAYIRHFLNSGRDVSPWLTTSRYNTVLSGVMSIETRLQPQLHRIKHMNFRELTHEDLVSCREYWAPWLLSRFMYHTMICLLNHPLLIILQLQGQKNDSELFRQQTSFYAAHHVRWLLYFIAFTESRDFQISDPTLGYCAAVVATIELQLLYSVDAATAQKKRRNIESCRRLVRRMGPTSRLMAQMDRKLNDMEDMMSTTFAANADQGKSITVDLSVIRDILDFGLVSPRDPAVSAADPSPLHDAGTAASLAQWTRLSRRPSVDQPDDGGSPASVQSQHAARIDEALASHPVQYPDAANLTGPMSNESPVHVDPSEFPANMLFNSYELEWWNAFECYDPDWPNFR